MIPDPEMDKAFINRSPNLKGNLSAWQNIAVSWQEINLDYG